MTSFKQRIKQRITNFIIGVIENLDSEKKAKLYRSLKKSDVQEKQNGFRKKYAINEQFRFNGDEILFYGKGEIHCGKNSYIGNYSTVQAGEKCTVKIGDNCSISHNVRMYTTSNESNQNFNTSEPKNKKLGNIMIHNGVWIGANVFLNPGVTIGENAVVGSNSVVTKDIEPNAIYGGVPARLIKMKQIS